MPCHSGASVYFKSLIIEKPLSAVMEIVLRLTWAEIDTEWQLKYSNE